MLYLISPELLGHFYKPLKLLGDQVNMTSGL